LKELQNELSMSSKKKEQIGVDLYGNQQQLARMQMALENLRNESRNCHYKASDLEGRIIG
jgi:hypothetical protein